MIRKCPSRSPRSSISPRVLSHILYADTFSLPFSFVVCTLISLHSPPLEFFSIFSLPYLLFSILSLCSHSSISTMLNIPDTANNNGGNLPLPSFHRSSYVLLRTCLNKITFKNVVARGDRRSFLYPLGEKPISLLFLHNPALCILLVDLYIVALVFIFVSNTYELWTG